MPREWIRVAELEIIKIQFPHESSRVVLKSSIFVKKNKFYPSNSI